MECNRARGSIRLMRVVAGVGIALAGTWSCDVVEQLEPGTCTYTFECQVGEVCQEGRCVPASQLVGEGGAGDGEPGAGGSGGETGTGGAGGQGGAGGAGGEPEAPRVTFVPNDYRRCFDSLECAVFGGNCLVELPLSRPLPDGTDRIRISDLDPTFEDGQGICGMPCTNEPRICDTLVATGPEGQSRASTCQVVFVGDSPYPVDPPGFPFALDLQAMARGVPYAAVCRPPFQYAEAHSPFFCQPCTEAANCGDTDACWLDRPFTNSPSGACVQRCELQSDCPFGFRCTDVDADDPFLVGEPGSYCLPIEGTCGRCLDRDGDQRGVGVCGPLDEPFTEVDCDDANPDAYFDPLRPTHPFPRFCGDFDLNCNGLSDRVEQLGSEEHCAFCGDACAGPVPNGVRGCVEGDDGWACTAICQPGFADCNGLVDDGCETELADGMLWARDRDGDGRGNPQEVRYFCDGAAPAGWVQNLLDCDDTNPSRYGGGTDLQGVALPPAPEICDGLDNDCNGLVDDGTVVAIDGSGNVIATEGEACDTGLKGVCSAGTFVCKAGDGAAAPTAMVCEPDVDPVAQVFAQEICNGLDDDCDGQVDEGADWHFDHGQSNPGGPGAPVSCPVPGGKGICATGVYRCAADGTGGANWICEPNQPQDDDPVGDGIDQNCDGIDGKLEGSIFVRPEAGGGTLNGNDANDGTAQRPVATLQRAVQLACANLPLYAACRDVYVDRGVYVSDQPLVLPTPFIKLENKPYIRIYGGFEATVQCDGDDCSLHWTRSPTARSVFVREAPAMGSGDWPYGRRYAAITGGGPAMELLLDRVDVEVRAPDPSAMLTDGASAPTQIGIECPSMGCRWLHFKDVEIRVDEALGGAAGRIGERGRVPPGGNDGRNGCDEQDTNCDWGTVHSPVCFLDTNIGIGTLDGFVTDAATCADRRVPYGGPSGGTGCGGVKWSDRNWLGGVAREAGLPGSYNQESYLPRRGDNGEHGSPGTYEGTGALRYDLQLGPVLDARYQPATSGQSGAGGNGGRGLVQRIDIAGVLFHLATIRGGAGGAGGCNGTLGGRGGDGGSAIGMVLVSPSTGSLKLETEGAFAVRVGRGGRGGQGGAGGAGAPGGWGGSGNQRGETSELYRGAEGGDGGGGGGGAGGHGGSSIGMWLVCRRAGANTPEACEMQLPAMLRASPDLFIEPGQAGKGGEGGKGGARGVKPPHMHGRHDSGAQEDAAPDGATGFDGYRHYLFFTGGA